MNPNVPVKNVGDQLLHTELNDIVTAIISKADETQLNDIKGLLPQSSTTGGPESGEISLRYNTENEVVELWNGNEWTSISGGSGSGNFQSVTDGEGNNITTNGLVINGTGGLNIADPNLGQTSGLALLSFSGYSIIQNVSANPNKIIISPDSMEIYIGSNDNRVVSIVSDQINFETTVAGYDAVNGSDFVPLAQVQQMIADAIAAAQI